MMNISYEHTREPIPYILAVEQSDVLNDFECCLKAISAVATLTTPVTL